MKKKWLKSCRTTCVLFLFSVPKKGKKRSINYSTISKILGEKNRERTGTEPWQGGVLEREELRGE